MSELSLDCVDWAQEILAGSLDDYPLPEELPEHCRRLRDAVDAIGRAHTGSADLAILVRGVLRAERSAHIRQPVLEVTSRRGAPWPTSEEWSRSVRVEERELSLRLTADEWHPDWLEGSEIVPPAAAASLAGSQTEERRRVEQTFADPMFSDIMGVRSIATYRGYGQRQAVRGVFASQPGATIVTVLATGTGKSAVALVPALQWSDAIGVTVVVVPTITLAQDQELALRELMELLGRPAGTRLAYYTGVDEDEKAEMRHAIRSGTQGVVFAGPEIVSGALSAALHDAASNGYLRLFVVDEAHLIGEWGAEFRPHFQQLSGLRRSLLRACPPKQEFRTLLMTATLTGSGLDALHTLFGDPGPFEVIASPVLRPEPEYWAAACRDEEQRVQRLLEALDMLPRPALVYVSLPEHAVALSQEVRSAGYSRVATVTGRDPADERLDVIEGLTGSGGQATRYDVVVATSAFGLGLDYGRIRTVVHACVPETIDRFYQEVGRSGRDGQASMSLVLHTPRDLDIASDLNRKRILTQEVAGQRWRAMLDHVGREDHLDGGRLRLQLGRRWSRVRREGSYNVAWNLRTIGLAARSHLLEIDGEPPPKRRPDETSGKWEARREEAFAERADTVVVRPLQDVERAFAEKSEAVKASRRAVGDDSARSLALMRQVLSLSPGQDIAQVLAEQYAIAADPGGRWPEIRPARRLRRMRRLPAPHTLRRARNLSPADPCACRQVR